MPPFFRRFAFPFGKFAKKNQSRNRPQKRKIFLKNPHFPPPLNCPRESTITSPHLPSAKAKPRASGIENRVVPAKEESVSAQAQSRPRTCRPPKRNPAIAELRSSGNRIKKKTEEKIYRLRGRIFIVGLFGSGVASSVSSSSKSGINDFSRFSGAADFSAGCSASTRMARLPLL